MRNFITCLVALLLISAGIVLSYLFISEGDWIWVPLVWTIILAGAAETINVGLRTKKKKDK